MERYCSDLARAKGDWFIIDNPDPTHLIQRVYLHGDKVKVIDNIPIEEARKLFEEELQKANKLEIVSIKRKSKKIKLMNQVKKRLTILNNG